MNKLNSSRVPIAQNDSSRNCLYPYELDKVPQNEVVNEMDNKAFIQDMDDFLLDSEEESKQ